MAEIDGQYEGPSVGRAIQRNKYKKAAAAKESAGGGGGGEANRAGGGGDVRTQLSHVHPHAAQAQKSFHVYQHPDGTHHAHAHDHVAGTHEHRPHPHLESAMQHMHEHLGGANEAQPPINMESASREEAAGGMGAMGLGGGPPMGG